VTEYTDHLYDAAGLYPYVTPADVIKRCKNAEGMSETDDRIIEAIDDATMVMYYFLGRQFDGTRQTTVRPPCLGAEGWASRSDWGCGCGCTPYQVNLGLWPVTQLNSVRYKGVTYTGSNLTNTFHINDWHYLARNDGDMFESGNQWALSGGSHDNVDDTFVFEATFNYGLKVPSLVTRATRALACEFIAVCTDKPCKLPDRTTSVVRQGLSVQIASAEDLLQNGRTGIYEVDLAISVLNPKRIQSPTFLWIPNRRYPSRINT